MTNSLLLDNFYPVISYRRVQKESDELSYTVWSLVTVRNQLPARVVELLHYLHYTGQTQSMCNCCRIELNCKEITLVFFFKSIILSFDLININI